MRFLDFEMDLKEISPLSLAFIGDCVYEMLVRESLVCSANRPVADLHRESVKFVSAQAQAAAFKKIEARLGEDEIRQVKRGRNAKVGHLPKSATQAEYHTATGFEALFGWLYLTEQFARIRELFKAIADET